MKRPIKKARKPLPIKRVILSLLMCLPLFLMGATPNNQPKFVAHAQSLNPPVQPVTPVQVEPLVKTEVIPYKAPETPLAAPQAPTQAPVATSSVGGLMGSLGYARAGGNCVNEPGVKRQGGNPISWGVSSRTPYIGATALFYFNHVGVVTGVWSNGDVEIRHQNFWGGQHRFPASMIRGYN